jgi:hypothetical protein
MSAASDANAGGDGWNDPAHLRSIATVCRELAATLSGPPRFDLIRYCRQLEKRAGQVERRVAPSGWRSAA